MEKDIVIKNLSYTKKIDGYYYEAINNISFNLRKGKISNFVFLDDISKNGFDKSIDEKIPNLFKINLKFLENEKNINSLIKNLAQKFLLKINGELEEERNNIKNLSYESVVKKHFQNTFDKEKKLKIKSNQMYNSFFENLDQIKSIQKQKDELVFKLKENHRNLKEKQLKYENWFKNSINEIEKDEKIFNNILNEINILHTKKNDKNLNKIMLLINNNYEYLPKIERDLGKVEIFNLNNNIPIYLLFYLYIFSYENEMNKINENLRDLKFSVLFNEKKISKSKFADERKNLKKKNIRLNYELLIESERKKQKQLFFYKMMENIEEFKINYLYFYSFLKEMRIYLKKIDKKISKKRFQNDCINSKANLTLENNLIYKKIDKLNKTLYDLENINKSKEEKILEFEKKQKLINEKVIQNYIFDHSNDEHFLRILYDEQKNINKKIKTLEMIISPKENKNSSNFFEQIKKYLDLNEYLKNFSKNELDINNTIASKIKFVIVALKLLRIEHIVIDFKNFDSDFSNEIVDFILVLLQVDSKISFSFFDSDYIIQKGLNYFDKKIFISKGQIILIEKQIFIEKKLILDENINKISYFQNRYKIFSLKKDLSTNTETLHINNLALKQK